MGISLYVERNLGEVTNDSFDFFHVWCTVYHIFEHIKIMLKFSSRDLQYGGEVEYVVKNPLNCKQWVVGTLPVRPSPNG